MSDLRLVFIKEKIIKYIENTIHPNDHYGLFCTITDHKTNEVSRVCGLGVPLEGYQYHRQDYRFPSEAADRNFKGIKLHIVKETEHGMISFNLEKLLDEQLYTFNVDKIPKLLH
jgi:hypothetical protein